MSEKPRGPEKTPDIPQRNGVELPHIQEARQLKIAAQRVREVTRRHNNAQGDMQDRREASDEFSAASMIDLGPGPDLPLEENFVESAEVKDAREKERNIARKGYQEQLKKTYEAHLTQVKDVPLEQQKLGNTYLEGCIKDLQISTEDPSEEDVTMLAETLPDAWRQTLLDPQSAQNNPELQKVRDAILDRVSEGAASIAREDYESDAAYQKALLDDIHSITGVSITVDEIHKLLGQNNVPDTIQKAFAPLAASGGDPEKQKVWKDAIASNGFYTPPSSEDLMQNAGEVIGDNPDFSELYAAYNGIKEPDPRINEFHRAAGLNAGPKTPWCMSFVQYVLRKHYGYQGPKTASARDGLRIGTSTSTPSPGDLVLMPRNGGSGYHIAFVQKVEGGTLSYWGGNQSDSVCTKTCDINKTGLQFRNITSNSSSLAGGH